MKAVHLIALGVLVTTAACSASNSEPEEGGSPSGSGATGSGATNSSAAAGGINVGTGGTLNVPTGGTGGEATCGYENFNLERKPAEILLVLDRSGSMLDPPDGDSSGLTKWELTVPALNEVLLATSSAISWGLKVFPEGTGEECVAESVTSAIDVPIAEQSAQTVVDTVGAIVADGNGTPTGDAMKQALAYMQTLTSANPKYILLATDGEPSCPGGQASARPYAVQAVTDAAMAGFHTFVVGVSTTKESATLALNDMAIAGLEPRPEANPLATKYYLANTKEELVSALQVITGEVSSCVFTLSKVPPAPDKIAVKVSGNAAPQDTTQQDGWDYTSPDNTVIEVFGSWCEQIQTSGNMLEIILGCPNLPPPK